MPHVNIKHFPATLDDDRRGELVAAITDAVRRAFDVSDGAVSIAVEPVEREQWTEQVYEPEIVGRAALLVKPPNY